jgi:DNA-damage-inducible protein D
MSAIPRTNVGKRPILSAKQVQKGLQALLGGKAQVGILPTVTILAKALATEMTNMNIQAKNLQGANENIILENLPAEEDIKKLERRVKSQTQKSLAESGKLESGN